ncbi:hypothetical protein GQ600_9577 [Phytophthora cactorum]|nr:hypothetical protein GQ600_9577 [Phytophthora cactorum]
MADELHDPREAVYTQCDLPARTLKIVGGVDLHEEVGEEVANEDEDCAQRSSHSVQLDVPDHVDASQDAGRVQQHVLAVGQRSREARRLGERLKRCEQAEC